MIYCQHQCLLKMKVISDLIVVCIGLNEIDISLMDVRSVTPVVLFVIMSLLIGGLYPLESFIQ